MSDLRVHEEKIKQWLADGPEEALEQLGFLVKSFDETAATEEIAYKDADETSDEEVLQTDEVADEEDVTEVDEETKEESTKQEDESEENGGDSVEEDVDEKEVSNVSFEAILIKTVDAALNTYHDTVIAPLLTKIAELEGIVSSSKTIGHKNIFEMDNDFLPAAAVTALVKERYGKEEGIIGDEVSDDEVKDVTETLESNTPSGSDDSGHLLSGLI